jgi:ribosome-associated translation inhibitor RaiA
MPALPPVILRADKRSAGRTRLQQTPMSIRGNEGVDEATRRRIRSQLGRALRPMATRIERVSLRFDDVNGPRGGIDTRCRVRVVLSGQDSVMVEQRGRSAEHAIALATPRLRRSLQRSVERRSGKAPPPSRPSTPRPPSAAPTARPARRTIKRRTHGMTVALEEPADRPSRKSTRGSRNRAKAGSKIGRATKRRKFSPTRRNTRGK